MTRSSSTATRELLVVATRRIARQRLEPRVSRAPDEVVRWAGAVQSQDYPMACWAVGQRMPQATQDVVTAAVADGTLLRTHVLRPTWHFVARDDLRWMLALTGPRVKARLVPYDSRGGLDAETVRLGGKALAAVFRDGRHRTREEVAVALKTRRLPSVSGWALGHLLMHAELDGLLCSGTPKGGTQTYALLDERASTASGLSGDEALAELARRYFQSHGPATERDFRWWSGLSAAASTRGIAALGRELRAFRAGDLDFIDVADEPDDVPADAHLLQPFDELVVAYADSRIVLDVAGVVKDRKPEGLLGRSLLADGQVVGRWRRELSARSVTVSIATPVKPGPRVTRAIGRAAARYAAFVGRDLAPLAFTAL